MSKKNKLGQPQTEQWYRHGLKSGKKLYKELLIEAFEAEKLKEEVEAEIRGSKG